MELLILAVLSAVSFLFFFLAGYWEAKVFAVAGSIVLFVVATNLLLTGATYITGYSNAYNVSNVFTSYNDSYFTVDALGGVVQTPSYTTWEDEYSIGVGTMLLVASLGSFVWAVREKVPSDDDEEEN